MIMRGIPCRDGKLFCYRAAMALKQELVYHRLYQDRKEAKQDIFEYIQVWYNRKRSHSSLGYLSPEEFEQKQAYSMAA